MSSSFDSLRYGFHYDRALLMNITTRLVLTYLTNLLIQFNYRVRVCIPVWISSFPVTSSFQRSDHYSNHQHYPHPSYRSVSCLSAEVYARRHSNRLSKHCGICVHFFVIIFCIFTNIFFIADGSFALWLDIFVHSTACSLALWRILLRRATVQGGTAWRREDTGE